MTRSDGVLPTGRTGLEKVVLILMGVYLFVLNLPGVMTVREGAFFAALVLAGVAVARKGKLSRPPMLVPFALWLGLALLSVTASVEPAAALSEIKKDIVYPILAFWLFHYMVRGVRDARFVSLFVLACAAGVLAVSFYLYYFEGVTIHDLKRTSYLYGQRFHFSFFLIATATLALSHVLDRTAPVWLRAFSALLIPFCALGVHFAKLRAGYLAIAASALIFLAWIARRTTSPKARVAAAVVALLVVMAVPVLLKYKYLERVDLGTGLVRGAVETVMEEERWLFWERAVEETSERPVLGRGFGDKEMLIPEIGRRYYPHNIFLSYGVMLGAAGPVALLVVFGGFLFRLLSGAGAERGPPSRVTPCGVMLLAVFVLMNLTDDLFTRHSGQFFFALMGLFSGMARGGDG